jgi:transcriptional regulator with XRE-family HTH domain
LRLARERRGWSLAALAIRTGVREQSLDAIERGSFDELPAGLYGRAAVRGYAAAVGLDVDAVLAEVSARLSPLEDPLDGLARVRGIARRRAAAPPLATVRQETATPGGPANAGGWRVAGATAVDSLLLVAINGIVWSLTSLALGVHPSAALAAAAPALFMLWALIAAVYFVLLGGIRNRTPGARLLGDADAADTGRVTLGGSVARGLRWACEESSITVQWLIGSEHGRQWLRALRQIRA